MAPSPTFANLTDSQEKLAQITYLQEQWLMPTPEWWSHAESALKKLCTIFEIVESDVESDVEADILLLRSSTSDASPSAVRSAILPRVVNRKVGAHILQLTSTNEVLSCVAFGNIDTSLFDDIFWEKVATAKEDDPELKLIVYEASNGSFGFSIDGQEFKLTYLQCNDLLRSYPSAITAPKHFLEDPKNDCRNVIPVIEAIKKDKKRLASENIDEIRLSYYYLRAWASVRGFFGRGKSSLLSPRDFLDFLFEDMPADKHLSVADYVQHFIINFSKKNSDPKSSALGARPFPEDEANDLQQLLETLRNRPIRDLMPLYPYFVHIQVMFSCSGLKGGQWLSMIEERLVGVPEIGTASTHLWPNRLVSESQDTKASCYEASYVLGTQDPTVIDNAMQKLKQRVEKDKDHDSQECFFNHQVKTASEFDLVFRTCNRKFPRKPLTDPNAKLEQSEASAQSKKKPPSKKPSPSPSTSFPSPPHPKLKLKLRPASEVLSRLRHDPRFDIDEFVVGYLDRHTEEIQEKPAGEWEAETTHSEFIPLHRVVYFKCVGADGDGREEKEKGKGKGKIWWDRRDRRDWVFGGGDGDGDGDGDGEI